MQEPSPFGTTLKAPDALPFAAADEGERLAVGIHDDSRGAPDAGACNPLGTDGGGVGSDVGGPGEGEPFVRTSDILERFAASARARLRATSLEAYDQAFRAFASQASLDGFTRRQLSGPKGRGLLLAYLETVPRPSWQWRVAALKAVWTLGLGLPWPLELKRDLGRLPPVRRRESPPDATVKAWADALAHEPDPYLRLLWLLVAQHGWRPSHVANLRWRHVRAGADGRPVAIVADGLEAGFKTPAPVAARLAPAVVEALEAWRRGAPEALPERPILPWRDARGKAEPGRLLGRHTLRDHWCGLRSKWRLPALRPVDLRHWVATACRRAGLSKLASAYLMGHDPAQGGAMRDWYDRPGLEDVFTEQGEQLPRGPLGLLEPPEIKLVEGLPPVAVELLRAYLAGEVGTMEMASRLEALRPRPLHGQGAFLGP